MKKIIRNTALCIIGSLFLSTLSGCFLMYKKTPDLHQAKWKSISVEYSVRKVTDFQKQTWLTTDQAVLDRLYNSLKVKRSGDLWGAGMMTTNKITLQLVNGKSFIIYIVEATKLCMSESSTPSTGFALDVTREFHDELKAIIESDIKTKIYFYEPSEYRNGLSKVEALNIAKEICRESGWQWIDVSIKGTENKWCITTNAGTRGMNAFIDIDKKTGKILRKDYNPR